MIVGHIILETTIADFLHTFWFSDFYGDFMEHHLGDNEIESTPWRGAGVEDGADDGGVGDGGGGVVVGGRVLRSVSRTITSKHPLAIKFPGLDSRVESTKLQSLAAIGDDQLVIVETASFRGMPYADHFVVVARWVVVARLAPSTRCGGGQPRRGGVLGHALRSPIETATGGLCLS